MNKKYIAMLGVLFAAIVGGIIAMAVYVSSDSTGSFADSGYILEEGSDSEKSISFLSGTDYNISQTGTVSVESESGTAEVISASNFVHLSDDSIMALSDGVLLDFSDLSSNFINNYYISSTLSITETSSGYIASTESGEIEFGEHLWKLSDSKYLIRANTLSVYFSDDDIRETTDFVEITVTEDGIVQILTEENVWMTISESCYIETENGVIINPVTQIIDDGTYKVSIPELSVSADDSIVLTEYEMVELIVPEFNVEITNGTDGADGSAGTSGTDGTVGTGGEDGTSGESGSEGSDGDSGDSGNSGVNGSNGVKGLDATIESSTNTALPTMTISYWNVTEDSLEASIEVSGGVEALELSDSKYDGSITITNVATGEVIYCYETDDLFTIYDTAYTGINFRTAVGLSFATLDNPLEPDTEYKLSVNAYYELNEVIYSREFIGRTFYTDSTGLQLEATDVEEDSITVDVTAIATLNSVKLYLLTAEQNETFSIASTSDADNYVATVDCSPLEGEITRTLTFGELNSNTEYVVRAVVNGIISDQEETVWTLKESPTWTEEDYPISVYYNRVDGAYEVYRPTIIDEDNGAVKYVYTAYDSTGTAISSKTLYSGDPEPVTFYLEAEKEYYFGVELYFNDNEKTITYDLGYSEHITAEGTTLPTVKWTTEKTVYYNSVKGTIEINMIDSSELQVGNSQPLVLNIYADQVIDTTIEITSGTTNGYYMGNAYTITYSQDENTNYAYVYVDFDQLLNNTNYTISVSGYVNLQDNNGFVNRTLGTVSFTTVDTSAVTASYTTADNSSSAISQTLALTLVDDGDGDYTEEQYIYNNLIEGQVTVQLYSGTGTSKQLIGTTLLTGTQTLTSLYTSVSDDGISSSTTGVTITEDDFNLPNLDTSSNYTLVISEVVDGSYAIDGLGYQNTFDDVSPSSKVITATPTPPDLTADPTSGVTAIPIYNSEATNYGAKYDEDLPDDTIIGYRVSASYDNSQRLGTTVTYYLYEYSEFYYAITTGNDPVLNAETLTEVTLPISSASDTVPEIAIFFEGVSFSSTITEGTSYMNGCYIYSGVDEGENYTRGYNYIFAYTAEYSTNSGEGTSATYTYPYDRSDYSAFMSEYGAGVELSTTLGKGVAYVLNSGMVSAPRALPEFYSYVYSTDASITSSTKVEGTVTVHYTYTDVDGTITTSVTAGSGTQIQYTDNSGGTVTENIGSKTLEDNDLWYQIAIPYVFANNSTDTQVLTPEVLIQDYVADMETTYASILATLSNNSYVDEPFYLSEIPVEYDYGALFTSATYVDKVEVVMTPFYDENYIKFTLSNAEAGSSAQSENLADRAYAMKLTFTPTSTSADVEEKTFYTGLSTDATGTVTQAIFSTSLLGSDFLGVEFKVTAEILYDDGNQGWAYVKNDVLFALQRINTIDQDEVTFQFGAYYAEMGSTLKYSSSGAVLEFVDGSEITNINFMSSLQSTIDGESYTRSNFQFLTTTYSFIRYYTVGHYGVQDNQSTDLNSISSYYVVPKGVGYYTLNFSGSNDANIGKVTSIVPTVGEIKSNVAVDRIVVSDFLVTGETEIAGYDTESSNYGEIVLRVYNSDTAAISLSDGYVKELVLKLDEDGTPIYGTTTEDGEQVTENFLSGLTEDTQYYLVFAADVEDTNGNSELTILLDQDTVEQAIYEFYTVDGILLTPSADGIYYQNDSYLEKSLSLTYTLNEYLGIEVEFDIYSSDQVTVSGSNSYSINSTTNTDGLAIEETPILSNDQMIEDKILITQSLAYTNYMTIDLEPDTARSVIVPGATYYMKITANTTGGGSATEKTYILPFTITSIGTIDALIYVDNATADSISYKVSIMDSQYSLMGDSTMVDTNGAAYVVSFTDETGKRIYTTYDDEVFYAGTLKQEFVLSNGNLAGASLESYKSGKFAISANTIYTLDIYSVLDETHNGMSYATTTSETDMGSDKSTFLTVGYTKLIELVDSFWYTTGSSTGEVNTSMSTVALLYTIASRNQTTTASDGLYIDDSSAIISVNGNSKFELMLQESYGITYVDDYGGTQQYFDEIVYSIEGRVFATETGVKEYGSTTVASEMFTETVDAAGYSIYTYEIPTAVEKGSYSVTVQLYKNGELIETFSSNYYYN